MTKKKELAKNTIIILLGKVCTQFVSFLLLPLYTAILATEEYGVVDLVTTYVGLLAPLISVQLENALFRYLVDARNKQEEKNKIITNCYITSFLLAVMVFIIFIIISMFINVSYKYYIAGMVFSVICSNMALQTARGNGKNTDFSIGSVIAGITTIALNVLFLVVLKTGIEGMFLATIIANILCFIYVVLKEKIYTNIKKIYYQKKQVYQLLKYSLPLVPNGLVWWIINVSDRTIITMQLGTAANGIYSVSNKFSNIIVQIYNIFNLSWTESASMHIEDEDRDTFFSETIQQTLKLFASLCVGMIAVMPFIFNIFVNQQYKEAYQYIPILVISSLFNVLVGLISVIYVAKKMTKKIAQTSIWSGIINIAINVLLIKYIGTYAACLSTLLAFAIMAIYRYIDVQKYVKIKIGIKNILMIIAMFTFCTIIYYDRNNVVLQLIGVIIALLYAIIANKTMLSNIWNIVRTRGKKIIKTKKEEM